jgi:hypothetical protein
VAYAFNAINNMLDQQQSQKQNIFGQSGSDANSQQGQVGAQPAVKTSTEGEMGNSSTSSGSTPQGGGVKADIDLGGTQATRAAYKANVGKTDQPKVLNDIDSQIKSNQDRLQQEANSYTANNQNTIKQSNAYTDQDFDNAANNDVAASNKIKSIYNKASQPVSAFDATDTNVKDADLLNTSEGLRSMVSRGQDENYTRGMGAFDLGVLQKTPGFSNLIRGLQGKASDLRKQEADTEAARTADLQKFADDNLAAARTGIETGVTNRANAINLANAQEAAQANARLAQLRQSGLPADEKAYLDSLSNSVKAKLMAVDPQAAALMDPTKLNVHDYMNIHGDYDAGGSDFVSQDEATHFNNLMSLIGNNQALTASLPVGPDFTFNQTAGAQALLDNTLKARQEQKTTTQTQIDQMLKAAQAAADAEDARRGKLTDAQAAKAAATKALSGNKDLLNLISSSNPGATSLTGVNLDPRLDPNTYFTRDKRDLGAKDVLTKTQADQLNKLNAILGVPKETYTAGGYNLATPGYGTFAQDKYFADLKALLAKDAQAKAAQSAQEMANSPDNWMNAPVVDENGVAYYPNR